LMWRGNILFDFCDTAPRASGSRRYYSFIY